MQITAQDAFEILFYENLLKRDRKSEAALELLGGLYSKHGMAKQALRVDRRLARLRPDDERVRYNLACDLALLGRKREAVRELERCLAIGYRDWDWLLQDPDLKSLSGYEPFERLLPQATKR